MHLMSKKIEWVIHIWRSNGIKTKSSKGRLKQRWFERVNDNLNKSSQRTVKSRAKKCSRGS
ncbi:putative nuclease HARBI1 [Aphis craccivora]|uniref:Putative nuclease HARBI1 n=1 Tax=Aphis craccivora TaxID=307492 RepID=A0A6G0ZJX5_APHCR|nr:putative nuclease HARBI1 [Aphis craccivora]